MSVTESPRFVHLDGLINFLCNLKDDILNSSLDGVSYVIHAFFKSDFIPHLGIRDLLIENDFCVKRDNSYWLKNLPNEIFDFVLKERSGQIEYSFRKMTETASDEKRQNIKTSAMQTYFQLLDDGVSKRKIFTKEEYDKKKTEMILFEQSRSGGDVSFDDFAKFGKMFLRLIFDLLCEFIEK